MQTILTLAQYGYGYWWGGWWFILWVLLFIFWVWMLIDALTRLPNTVEKLIWVLVIVFLWALGAFIYMIFRRPATPGAPPGPL